jgi:hypothetical protein
MLITTALEKQFLRLGAKRVEVTTEGVSTHWLTLSEARACKDKFEEISFAQFGRAPERIEVFKDHCLWACFVKWPMPGLVNPRRN